MELTAGLCACPRSEHDLLRAATAFTSEPRLSQWRHDMEESRGYDVAAEFVEPGLLPPRHGAPELPWRLGRLGPTLGDDCRADARREFKKRNPQRHGNCWAQ